jgi:hypothetical protein
MKQEYPKHLYHRELPPVVVAGPEEHDALGDEWKESPAHFEEIPGGVVDPAADEAKAAEEAQAKADAKAAKEAAKAAKLAEEAAAKAAAKAAKDAAKAAKDAKK